jgi:drug/metabolite transporter (DMT)-like permease
MRRSGAVQLGILALIWGSSFLWTELALTMLAPSWITLIRLALGAVTLAVWCVVRGYKLPRGRQTWSRLLMGGALANVAPYFFFAMGQDRTSSAYAGIINGTTPLWTALTLTVVSRNVPTRVQVGGLAIGFFGTILVIEPRSYDGFVTLPGVLACLVAAALYGVSYVYLSSHVMPLPYNSVALAAGQLFAATALSVTLLAVDGATTHQPTISAVVAVSVLGICGTGLAYVLNYSLLVVEGPTSTSLVAYLIPLVATALGVIVLGDRLPPFAALGGSLVLAGVALIRRRPRGHRRRT